MMRALLATTMVLALGTAPASAYCKLALALALDISSSVNDHEYRLQLHGLASALDTKEVQQAILTPEGAHIQAAVYEWSGYRHQRMIADWTRLDTPGAISAFTERLRQTRRQHADQPTALGKAIQYGANLLRRAPPCGRLVLDVSGDGENNDGIGPQYFREQGQLDGLIINGLVILGAFPNPAIYYREHVIQGPGAFLAQAMTFEDYRDVMLGKLLREIETDMIVGKTER